MIGNRTPSIRGTGHVMFLFRSMFWLTAVVLILPPADGEQPPPRVSLFEAASAARVLVQDVAGLCDRNADACSTSRDAFVLFQRKVETGAGILAAGTAEGEDFALPKDAHGTLTEADLRAEWAGPAADDI